MKNTSRLPLVLLVLYIIEFAVLSIHPFARDVWFTENMTILPIVAILAILYWRGIRFSNAAYVLMSFLIFMHTLGGHYTFERVPFGFVTHLFGFERNNYDRFAHATVGFYGFALIELIEAYGVIRKRWVTYLFALFAIMAVALSYELFEWLYAVNSDPTAGIAVLGSQGDIWDAQKDMLSDTVGGLIAVIAYVIAGRKRKNQ